MTSPATRIVSPAVTTTYTLTGVNDVFNCPGSMDPASATVTVSTPPSVDGIVITAVDETPCVDSGVVITWPADPASWG